VDRTGRILVIGDIKRVFIRSMFHQDVEFNN
jgi:hypothetical protein